MGTAQNGNGRAPTYTRLLEFRVSFVLPDFRISGKVTSVSKMDGKVARIMKGGCSTSRERTETRVLLVVSSVSCLACLVKRGIRCRRIL